MANLSRTTASPVQAPFHKVSQPCPSYTPEAWAKHRELITNLYVDEDLTLRQVRTILEEDHGFPATERQYKRKIKEWKLDKNVKDEEMRLILQVEKKRRDLEGKESVFHVRGRLVDRRKLHRFVQRKGGAGIYLSTDLQNLVLPEDITCQTPGSEFTPSCLNVIASEAMDVMQDEEVIPDFDTGALSLPQKTNADEDGILVDHASLNSFWQPYWFDHDPGKDISDFQSLNLPIQIPAMPNVARMQGSGHCHPQVAQEMRVPNIDENRNLKRRRLDHEDPNTVSQQTDSITISNNMLPTPGFSEEANQSGCSAGIEENGGMSNLAGNLRTIREQQSAIMAVMNALRDDQDRLRSVSSIFETNQSHHEHSVNAILGFLAAVYSKSLQGSDVDIENLLGGIAEG